MSFGNCNWTLISCSLGHPNQHEKYEIQKESTWESTKEVHLLPCFSWQQSVRETPPETSPSPAWGAQKGKTSANSSTSSLLAVETAAHAPFLQKLCRQLPIWQPRCHVPSFLISCWFWLALNKLGHGAWNRQFLLYHSLVAKWTNKLMAKLHCTFTVSKAPLGNFNLLGPAHAISILCPRGLE